MIEWACDIETHVCQMLDRHVLHAIIVIGVCFLVLGLGWLLDAILKEQRK